MGDTEDDRPFGTAASNAPVTRADFERALRSLSNRELMLRNQLLHLAAQVVSLSDELTRRLDGVEPRPAPLGTLAKIEPKTIEDVVDEATPKALDKIRMLDSAVDHVMSIDVIDEDKYKTVGESPPCEELMPICQARCCRFVFPLSTQDLDEGIIRWDYGNPYTIRQRGSDGYCVHNHPETHGCTVHGARPRVCRSYTCKDDKRIWADFDKRILAEPSARKAPKEEDEASFDLMERARNRSKAIVKEARAIIHTYAESKPARGPKL